MKIWKMMIWMSLNQLVLKKMKVKIFLNKSNNYLESHFQIWLIKILIIMINLWNNSVKLLVKNWERNWNQFRILKNYKSNFVLIHKIIMNLVDNNIKKKTLIISFDDCILKSSIFKEEFPRNDGMFKFQKLKIFVCFRNNLKFFL